MELKVRFKGLELAQARLATVGRRVDPVMRGALNTTVTATRKQRFTDQMTRSLKRKRLNDGMKIKRANTRNMNARIIPSSSGVDVTDYLRWGFDPIDATRARIWVMGPNGKKVAAGFVNPSSAKRRPLTTRSQKRTARATYTYQLKLQEAMGPSVAYWFKQYANNPTVRWINVFLIREFEKRIRRELAKGPR